MSLSTSNGVTGLAWSAGAARMATFLVLRTLPSVVSVCLVVVIGSNVAL